MKAASAHQNKKPKLKDVAKFVESSDKYITANTKKTLNIIQLILAGIIIFTSVMASFEVGTSVLIDSAILLVLIFASPIVFKWLIGRK